MSTDADIRRATLSADPALWGRAVADERYAMVVHPSTPPLQSPGA